MKEISRVRDKNVFGRRGMWKICFISIFINLRDF